MMRVTEEALGFDFEVTNLNTVLKENIIFDKKLEMLFYPDGNSIQFLVQTL